MECEEIQAVCDRFGQNDTFVFAMALGRRTGWELMALSDGASPCIHAAVRSPQGLFVDAYGAFSSPDAIEARYDIQHPRWRTVDARYLKDLATPPQPLIDDAEDALDTEWMMVVLEAAGHNQPRTFS